MQFGFHSEILIPELQSFLLAAKLDKFVYNYQLMGKSYFAANDNSGIESLIVFKNKKTKLFYCIMFYQVDECLRELCKDLMINFLHKSGTKGQWQNACQLFMWKVS